MGNFFSSFTDRYKLFAYVFLVSVGGLLISLFGKGIEATLAISAGIGLILFIAKPIWYSDKYGETTVRLVSLGVAGSAVAAFVGWPALLETYLKPVLKEYYPNVATQSLDSMAIAVFIFLAVVIYIVNNFRRDQTGMGVHPTPIDRDVPEPSFKDRLKAVCGALTDDLRGIDQKTNWSARLFTPLDAEVEVNTPNGKERRVTDLLKAIKRSKNRLFLVLGTPGSGKSVALRKLCQDLAEEVDKTGKIPIYINLREWHVERKWTEDNPPTLEELHQFVFNNVKSRDIVTSKFFDKYFERLYETGRLYFVFDSFDEIPAVLDEKENSELIHQLSEVIFKFLKGARQAEAQGILASRLFRKPTREFQTEVTLEIRPFTEQKIISTFENYGIFTKEIIKTLFKDRQELVPIARNPFSAVLIAEYIEHNENKLPPNQSEMYADYFSRTLDNCTMRMEKKNLNKESLINYTIEIASTMFKEYGLEAPVSQLINKLPNIPVEDVIDILKFARLGRLGSGDDNFFSFSHRRFVEYFSVQKIIKEDQAIDLYAIPTDSQWRDALVLYCEVASVEKATVIANFCWNVIDSIKNPQDIRVIHSMRFLRDAFKGRLECIQGFNDELAQYIYDAIRPENNVISVKIALETVSLLSTDHIDECVIDALSINNPILEESSINACRNLPEITPNLNKKIKDYLSKLTLYDIFLTRHSLLFTFSLSEAFKGIKNRIRYSLFVIYSLLFFLVVFLFFSPFIVIGAFLLSAMFMVIVFLLRIIFSSFREKKMLYEISFLSFLFLLLFLSVKINTPYVFPIVTKSNICETEKCYKINDIGFIKEIISGFSSSEVKLQEKSKLSMLLTIKDKDLHFSVFLFLMIVLMAIFRYYGNTLNIRQFIWFGIVFLALIFILNNMELISKYELFISAMLFLAVVYMFFRSILMVFKVFKSEFIYYNEIKKIDYGMLKSRENIYFCMKNTKIIRTKKRIVEYLELHVKNVSGEWPDPSILSSYHTDDVHIRLARLEEKWLGLDR
ncbi:NACHT domain-containing protein [Thiothrix subterranea]|uniref:NACHT domain-containing protein n=1 Tax=Thiothrix subterranea TaxID=2735563 RepID=UPI00192C7DF8|nr:NACHT domain-containing protein [Thiothrix subterranea]QQZ29980.1 NACHT domain-containing protein [Thiothrix subterranea]